MQIPIDRIREAVGTRREVSLEPTRWGAVFTREIAWRLRLDAELTIVVDGKPALRLPLWKIRRAEAETGIVWSAVVLGWESSTLSLDGADRDGAWRFVKELQLRVADALRDVVREWSGWLESRHAEVLRAASDDPWPTSDRARQLVDRIGSLPGPVPLDELRHHPEFDAATSALSESARAVLGWLRQDTDSLLRILADRFTVREAGALADFFRSVERKPLTAEQVHAAVCWAPRELIVAAAGAGKTSVLIAKTGYGLKRGLVRPSEVLLLAFNKDAAAELRERLHERLGSECEVDARTTHAVALSIIGAATGKAPSIAAWVERGEDTRMVQTIIEDLRRNKTFAQELDLLRTIFPRDLGVVGESEPEVHEKGSRPGFRTRNGLIVRSPDEQMIADWLFFHGIDFRYEQRFPHDTADARHRQYRPDFFYPEIDLWHEHFALRSDGTSTFNQEYVESVAWKREQFAKSGMSLFETTSAELRGPKPFERLAERLRAAGLRPEFDASRPNDVDDPLPLTRLAALLRTAMQHAKGQRLTPKEVASRCMTLAECTRERMRLLGRIYTQVAREWERRLSDEDCVDFDDLIQKAASHVQDRRWQSPYRLVMVDEFQDTSAARAELINALVSQRKDTTLAVVGDDWQSINRFAGADSAIMREFSARFGDAWRTDLSESFRFTQPLADASRNFICENPLQLTKSVRARPSEDRAVHVLVCAADDADQRIEAALERLTKTVQARGEAGPISVFLLARYHRDRPSRTSVWTSRFAPRLRIEFKTIHASKGLEADYVFILGLLNGRNGFPSAIEDDPFIAAVAPGQDAYPFAEERRVFYVALTRARRLAILCTVKDRYSQFVVELARAGVVKLPEGELCEQCRRGWMIRRDGERGPFLGCNRFPACSHTRSAAATG